MNKKMILELQKFTLNELEATKNTFEYYFKLGHKNPADKDMYNAVCYWLNLIKGKFTMECPECGSNEIKLYCIDPDKNIIPLNADLVSHQCTCEHCGYDDDRFYFDAHYRKIVDIEFKVDVFEIAAEACKPSIILMN